MRSVLCVSVLCVLVLPVSGQGTPLFEVAGDTPGGWPGFGHVLAGGQDVDGDGIPDLLVGAPYENGAAGQARLLSGADGSELLVVTSVDGGHFGDAVALLGDVDGDGTPDLAVGANEYTPFAPLEGYAEVRSGSDGSLIHRWDGVGARDQFGDAIANAGDVDGDGLDDVIVGAPLHDAGGSDRGMARVFAGGDGALLHSWVGLGSADHFGSSVAGVGDLDGDGFADLAVGAPGGGPANFAGQVRVFSGQTGATLFSFDGALNEQLGWSLAGAGDVDGDGTPDLVYGVPNGFGGAGGAVVRSGADGSVLHAFAGSAPGNSSLGRSVAGAGDVNGDGFADVVVGDHLADGTGLAQVYSGLDGAPLWCTRGSVLNDRVGESVTGLGDVDGDGLDDVAVGASQFSQAAGTGFVRVLSGRPALLGDVAQLSLAQGGALTLSLRVPQTHAGGLHWVFGSITGFAPGLVFPSGVQLPLNPDVYFDLTLQAPVFFPAFVGQLDGAGEAQAVLVVPPGLDPLLAGLTFHHAFLARKAYEVDFASNPVPLTLEL